MERRKEELVRMIECGELKTFRELVASLSPAELSEALGAEAQFFKARVKLVRRVQVGHILMLAAYLGVEANQLRELVHREIKWVNGKEKRMQVIVSLG